MFDIDGIGFGCRERVPTLPGPPPSSARGTRILSPRRYLLPQAGAQHLRVTTPASRLVAPIAR